MVYSTISSRGPSQLHSGIPRTNEGSVGPNTLLTLYKLLW